MSTILNGLNIGYSGLKSSQIAIDTIGHNIANAENPDYSRQRVSTTTNAPLNTTPGDIGLGTKIAEIVRIHDEFIYKQLKESSSSHEYNTFRQTTLDRLSTYFPEIDQNGIYQSMQEYFNAWNEFAKNSDDSALKLNLAEQTRIFTARIREAHDQIQTIQNSLEEQLKMDVDEINRIGKEIADLNKQISMHEANGNHANDLRDQRDKLELTLSKLVDISVSKGDLQQNRAIDSSLREAGVDYHLNIGGASIIDGQTFHPIVLQPAGKDSPYSNIFYQRQDNEAFDLTGYIKGGEVAAILSLRGSNYDEKLGKFINGDIQKVLDELDSFASTLITNTNNIYAEHATTSMEGSTPITANQTISQSNLPIQDGSFYVKIYDINGKEIAKREITVTQDMTFNDIAQKIAVDNLDDSHDNTYNNDVDDFLSVNLQGTFQIQMNPDKANDGYTFAIEEKDPSQPTRFAGALGLERFFDGTDASNIKLSFPLDRNPVKVGGNTAPIAGDNQLANKMVELQYDKVDYFMNRDVENVYASDTLDGFFRMSATQIANTTASAHIMKDTSEALLTSVVAEFDSISKVNIDEELTNLMKYQTGYSASAKVITTIDQMIQTLLGMKQ